jgi:hypothetical protein
MFNPKVGQQDRDNYSGGRDGNSLGSKVGAALLTVAATFGYVTAARWSGAVEHKGIRTTRELEHQTFNALGQAVAMLRVDTLLSQAPVTDMASEGPKHAVFSEVNLLIADLERSCGKRHLEMPLLPGDEMSKERRLYAACLHLVAAMRSGDVEQTKLAKARVLYSLSSFKE